jgi:hypothetical protein
MLQADAGAALAKIAEEIEPQKPFLINCQGMGEIDDHALAKFAATRRAQNRQVVFLNAAQLVDNLTRSLGNYNASYATPDGSIVYVFGGGEHLSKERALKSAEDARDLELDEIKTRVRNCFRKYDSPKRLTSTPLLATGVFNARSLISDPDVFVWPCLVIAEYVDRLLEEEKPRNPRLLAVSLRGSPFAAAVRLIDQTVLPIEVVDHMGPRHKILEEHSLKGPSHAVTYIFIGDFIVGGTELRIAEAYAHGNGSVLGYAVVLGCALPGECYSSQVRIKSLVGVLSECCPDAKFGFNDGDVK